MEHDHSKSTQKVSEETLIKISEFFKSGIEKPKEIIYALRKDCIIEQSVTQLTNYLQQLRGDKQGPSTVDLNQLRQWSGDNNNIPEDQDQLFVSKFDIGINEKKY